MNKKKLIAALAIAFLTIFICSLLAKYYDSARVTTGHEPELVFNTYNEETEAVTYWGLGYKVVRYVAESPEEPYENNVGTKMGSWFMKYEKPTFKEVSVEMMEEGKTVLVTELQDISALSDCLNYQKYSDEVCEGIVDYKINIEGELYYVKSSCLGINHNGKEAHITKEDLKNILNVLERY